MKSLPALQAKLKTRGAGLECALRETLAALDKREGELLFTAAKAIEAQNKEIEAKNLQLKSLKRTLNQKSSLSGSIKHALIVSLLKLFRSLRRALSYVFRKVLPARVLSSLWKMLKQVGGKVLPPSAIHPLQKVLATPNKRKRRLDPKGTSSSLKSRRTAPSSGDIHSPARREKLSSPDLRFGEFSGHVTRRQRRPTILVCSHAANATLAGGELSFLDLVDGFRSIDYNVIATVPGSRNPGYFGELLNRCSSVVSFPYEWWTDRAPISDAAVRKFADVIATFGIDAVHANTIMLREPLCAARQMGVPGVVHARELLLCDPTLSARMGGEPFQITQQVVSSADYIIANSDTCSRAYDKLGAKFVIPNCVDHRGFDFPNQFDPRCIRVGLISSCIPKKGIYDFVKIAQKLVHLPARFELIGPKNAHIGQLERAQAAGLLPDNIGFPGYFGSPAEAIARVNIVVNLSHFQESFGRTIVEAFAARRPVVAYDWGAVSEIVTDGETGFLVPFLNVDAAAERIGQLVSDPRLITSYGEAGRALVVKKYTKEIFGERLEQAYARILRPGDKKGVRRGRQPQPTKGPRRQIAIGAGEPRGQDG